MALPLILIFPLYSHLPESFILHPSTSLRTSGLNSAILISVRAGPRARPALFPLLLCTQGNTQQRGKPVPQKRPVLTMAFAFCGFWLNCIAPSPASLDFVNRLQQLPPDIPLGIALFKSAGFNLSFHRKIFPQAL